MAGNWPRVQVRSHDLGWVLVEFLKYMLFAFYSQDSRWGGGRR